MYISLRLRHWLVVWKEQEARCCESNLNLGLGQVDGGIGTARRDILSREVTLLLGSSDP
jgi:hypothetical protein